MTDRSEENRPSFNAFHAKDGRDDKSYFTRVGVAFAHKDGEGHTIELDAMPVDGRIILRTPKERLEEAREEKPRRRNREQRDR